MKKMKINRIIKCDTLYCHQNATYMIETNSFKGNQFLCNSCYNEMKNLFKKESKNDD